MWQGCLQRRLGGDEYGGCVSADVGEETNMVDAFPLM